MNYNEYQAEDFAAIESFQSYFLYKSEEDQTFWEKWIQDHPHKEKEVEEAKQLLSHLKIKISDQEIGDSFSELQKKIEKDLPNQTKIVPFRRRFFQILAATAAITLLLFTGNYFLESVPDVVWTTTNTSFGEIKEVTLPDGSQIVLNSNSTLKYDSTWSKESQREVWLEGEAFFTVNKKPIKGTPTFIVHSNDTEVAVLGTVFNVYNRNGKVAVVLESGAVEVQYKKPESYYKQRMLPNDMFEIDAEGNVKYQQAVNTQLYTSWKENKLVLEQTPLTKVVNILEENFGFEVEVAKQEVLNRKLTATIPILDINILLEALREIYGLNIKKEDQKIWIE